MLDPKLMTESEKAIASTNALLDAFSDEIVRGFQLEDLLETRLISFEQYRQLSTKPAERAVSNDQLQEDFQRRKAQLLLSDISSVCKPL